MAKVTRGDAIKTATTALGNLQDDELVAIGLRVQPYRAVQILGSTTHRRVTPPVVIDMSTHIWLESFTKN